MHTYSASCRAFIDLSNMVPNHPWSYWVYAPTNGVPIVFAILWLVSGSLHIYQNMVLYKNYRISFFLPWAAAIFVAGFVLREYGVYHYHDLNIFIASQVLIFCAPPVYAAASYFIFGRTLYYIPYLAIIHPGRVLSTFLGIDGIVEAIAGNGIALAANRSNTPSKIQLGVRLIKASLFLQLALFVAFIVLVVHFHRACKQNDVFTHNIKIILYELYAVSFLILFRNCFRTASFFYSYTSTANSSEALFYCMEVLPMLICTYIFNFFPPAKYLPRNYKTYLAVDGKTELEGPGKLDKRPLLLTVFDPLDLVGMITGRDKKLRFWEEDGIGGPKKGAWEHHLREDIPGRV